MLENNKEYFRIEITFAINSYQADLVQPELSIATITSQIAKKQMLATAIQADLQKNKQIETQLLQKIDLVNQQHVITEFKYTHGITYDDDYNPYTLVDLFHLILK